MATPSEKFAASLAKLKAPQEGNRRMRTEPDPPMDGFMPKPEIEGAMRSFWDSLDLAVAGVVGDPEKSKTKSLRS
jgi:hypothetical protein